MYPFKPLIAVVSLNLYCIAASLPLESQQPRDSAINTIVIPYAPYNIDLIKDAQGKIQKVYVPLKMEVAPRIPLKTGQIAMGSQKGVALNIAEGAYPVYYMSGHLNGQFRDKSIYILEGKS